LPLLLFAKATPFSAKLIGLGAAAGKYYFIITGADEHGDFCPCFLDSILASAHRNKWQKDCQKHHENMEHRLHDFRVSRGSGGIVKIYRFHS